MKTNPLLTLETLGQSVWLDFLSRPTIASGQLKRLIDHDGVSGVTSNPAIFEKAIAQSHDYDADIRRLARTGKGAEEIYERLVVEDIQRAADVFRLVYDDRDGRDGFVSLEVSPHLAHDRQGTIAEARRLWAVVDRPNLLIKVPATEEGLPAIRQLISEGINVNITLLFGLPRYRQVTEAYLAGLEARAAQGRPLQSVASVASFFLSRIDVLIDPQLDRICQGGWPAAELANALRGQAAIASAKVAYQIYKEVFAGPRFKELAKRGARTQRLLWASTGTKNPAYQDVKYVEPLIGPETVNTLPLETLEAYRDHGQPAVRLEEGVAEARHMLGSLAKVCVNLIQATQQLEDEGVEKFNQPFDQLMETLRKACVAAREGEPQLAPAR